MKRTDRNTARRAAALALAFLFLFTLAWMNAMQEAQAAVDTVTLAVGKSDYYGDEDMMTHVRWVTHVNGEAIDLDLVPGTARSYAYCVEPNRATPAAGQYKVSVIDDDDAGRSAKMRKLIYYLPGSYGYKKLTKQKWFAAKDTGASDYAVAHVALSWLYDKQSEQNHAWAGAGSDIQKLVKKMVADLDDLPDPPDDFEVFWIKSESHQDTFGALYRTEYGRINVHKISAIPEISDGNRCYSLSGAEYTLYTDSGCNEAAQTSDGKAAVLHLNEEGDSETIELETGSYYMKETSAPRGYAMDAEVHSVEISKDKTTTYSAGDVPKNAPVELLVQKVDRETGLNRPQGGATLMGAEYTVSYYSEMTKTGMTEDALEAAVSDSSPALINGSEAVWVLKTDENGRIDLTEPEKCFVSGPDFYRDSGGRPCFPIGIIRIEETKAPDGYERSVHVWYLAVTEAGKAETLTTLKVLDGSSPAEEQVIRGDVCLTKTGEGRGKMAGVLFRFTSETTGESRMMVTDENGFLSSASEYASHTAKKSEGASVDSDGIDGADGSDGLQICRSDGIWFNGYNDDESGAKPDDSLGAFPYDTYLMEEVSCEANEGFELVSDRITIAEPRVTVDLGTYTDLRIPEPEISTAASDKRTGTHKARAADDMIIEDLVRYKGVRPGKNYTFEGVLVDKSTGKLLLDDDGNEIRGSAEFYAQASDGEETVEFRFGGSSLNGMDAVVYEYLKLDGETIAAHADIKSSSQTVSIRSDDPPAQKTPPSKKHQGKTPPLRKAPGTGDVQMLWLYAATAAAAALEILVLTLKRRNDRLN